MRDIMLVCDYVEIQGMKMAFRADEAARAGLERVLNYFLPRAKGFEDSERDESKGDLLKILQECGPVVDAYPSWHPLVRNHDSRHPVTTPGEDCGYKGLDHTRYFANGLITCPYGDGQAVMDSVLKCQHQTGGFITAERLSFRLYHPDATPILVRCHWEKPLDANGMIPLAVALPLLLEKELPMWRWAEVAETWKSMRPYFLGMPQGSRSSLFVSQDTGLALKKIWEALINTGMYGPIKERD